MNIKDFTIPERKIIRTALQGLQNGMLEEDVAVLIKLYAKMLRNVRAIDTNKLYETVMDCHKAGVIPTEDDDVMHHPT